MGSRTCITAKGAAGIVTQDRAKAARDLYDDELAELNRKNIPNAPSIAEQRTLEALKRQALAKKKATIATLRAQEAIRGRIEGQRGGAAGAALSLIDFDPTGKHTGMNVRQMAHFIENQSFALLRNVVEKFRVRWANLDKVSGAIAEARRSSLYDIARELFGEDSGSQEARNLAKGVNDAFEYLRNMFNASGGSIAKLEKWGLPQSWNRRLLAGIDEPGLSALGPAAIRARKAQIFSDFIMPLLDRTRMIDFDTGLTLSDAKLNSLLHDIYETIVTGGLSDVKAGYSGSSNLVSKKLQSRFLIFKDADSWLKAHERFSGENIFDVIVGHVRSMSRDIAMLRMMGANPEASAQLVEKLIASETGQKALEGTGRKAMRSAGDLFGGSKAFRRNFDLAAGKLDTPENSAIAVVDESNRNVLQAALLGGAVFSALSDRATTWASNSLLHIPQGRVLVRFLKNLNPASIEDQKLAAQLAFGVEDMLGGAIVQARYTGELLNPSVTRTLADSVLRASVLVRLTTAGRIAFQIEMLGNLTRLRGLSFTQLPEGIRRGFALHGVTRTDWDTLRVMQPWRDPKTGAEFLRPHDLIGPDAKVLEPGPLFDKRFEVAQKFMNMIYAERDFAVPSTSSRARADALFGTRPGSGSGFFARNVALLKSFPLSLMYLHLNRALNAQVLSGMTRAKFLAHIVIGSTVLGALATQLKQIAAGKDPLDMTTPSFWLKAASTGGGMGVMGDLVFGDTSRLGSFTDYLLGPVLSEEVPKALALTLGNVQEAITTGAPKNAGRELTQFARLMTPGRSLWYTALAADRLVFDEIQKLIDPGYAESFSRQEARLRSQYGQEFWSPPGTGLPPPRGPNARAIAGGP